jgi:threonine/homoserine/homoserine lactone efflux protein
LRLSQVIHILYPAAVDRESLSMLKYLILGASYGFFAAVQPGQFQAYLVSQAMTNGWRRTVPAALAPLLSDIPVISLVLLVLTQVPPLFLNVLQIAGGIFLLYLAFRTFKETRSFREALASPAPVHRTILKAALVNLLNPNPYLAWALILGPLLLEAWRKAPGYGIGLVAAFYITMILITAAIVTLLAAARSIGPRVARALLGLSAVALAGFGLYQLWAGSTALV